MELLGELEQRVGGDRTELNAALNGTLEKLKQVTERNDSGKTVRQLVRNIRVWRERNTLQSIASMAAMEELQERLQDRHSTQAELRELTAQLQSGLERFGDRKLARRLADGIRTHLQKAAVGNPELLEALQQVSRQLERTQNASKFELVQRLADKVNRSMRDIVDRRTAVRLGEAIARRQLRDRLLYPQLRTDLAEGMAAVGERTARRAQRLEVLRANLDSLVRRLDASLDRVARLKTPHRLGRTPGEGGRVDDRPARQVTPELARSLHMELSHAKE